jgi:adenosine deaminase
MRDSRRSVASVGHDAGDSLIERVPRHRRPRGLAFVVSEPSSPRESALSTSTATVAPLCDLHVHLYGCIRPLALLRHLAAAEDIQYWEWYESEFEAVYGFVPPARQLVERYRSGDKSAIEEFAALYVVGDADAGNFARFQAKGHLTWVATDYTPDRLEREVLGFARGVRDDLIAQGIAHVELRTFPTGPHALFEMFARDADRVVQRAVATLPRENPLPVWEQVKEILIGDCGHVVTAIDFSGVEEGFPPRQLAELFDDVHAFNEERPDRAIAILDHVGESFTDKSIESAIRWVQEAAELGANRIGHAIALGIDPASLGEHTRTESVSERRDQIIYDLAHADELRRAGVRVDIDALHLEEMDLAERPTDDIVDVVYDRERLRELRDRQDVAMKRVRATGAVIEVCPTSNRRIGGITDPQHHPIHRFLAAGLPVVVSTDDPGIFDITLHDELGWVVDVTGMAELRDHLIESAWRSRAEVLSGRTDEQPSAKGRSQALRGGTSTPLAIVPLLDPLTNG